jgi:hypothetical protein
MNFEAQRIVDNGSFGVVFQATVKETGEIVAIKKVLQDRRFKNRELQIMKMLKHPCICELKSFFYSNGDKSDELYLNLVLEFVPKTVYKVAQSHIKRTRMVPRLHIKLYMYQVRRRSSCLRAGGGGVAGRPAAARTLARVPSRAVLRGSAAPAPSPPVSCPTCAGRRALPPLTRVPLPPLPPARFSSAARWHTSAQSACATATSSRRTCWLTRRTTH